MIPGIKIMSLAEKGKVSWNPDFHTVTYRGTKVMRPYEVKEHQRVRRVLIQQWLDANTQGECVIANGHISFKDYNEALLFYMRFK